MARYSLGLLEIIDHCSTANTGPKSPAPLWSQGIIPSSSSLISSFQFSDSSCSTCCCWPRATCPGHVPASETRSRHVPAPAWPWGAPWTRRGAATSTASSGTRRTGGSTSTAPWSTLARWVTNYIRVRSKVCWCNIPSIPDQVQEEFINFKSSRSVFMIESSVVGKLASIKIANFLQFKKMMTRRKFSVFVLQDSKQETFSEFVLNNNTQD